MPQIEETARAVRALVASAAALTTPGDVHLIQMKGAIPSFTHAEAEAAARRARPCAVTWCTPAGRAPWAWPWPRGGAGVRRSATRSCSATGVYSAIASCSAKPGLRRTELLAFANSGTRGGAADRPRRADGPPRRRRDPRRRPGPRPRRSAPRPTRRRWRASSACSPRARPTPGAPCAGAGTRCSATTTSPTPATPAACCLQRARRHLGRHPGLCVHPRRAPRPPRRRAPGDDRPRPLNLLEPPDADVLSSPP
jgi:hypothetical protein